MQCKNCNSTDVKRLGVNGNYILFRCNECKFVFKNITETN